MRTRKGLPFVCTKYMKLILESTMARVQRDHKVILCHYLWMGNHPHIIIVARDSSQCTRFYGELKKQLTEAVKQLLGRSHLSLWQKNGTSVVHYGDAEGVQERIAYLYANPARAHLVDSIERYPGSSSWESFKQSEYTFSAMSTKNYPRIHAPAIPRLPAASVTPAQDNKITNTLKTATKKFHTLTLHPNAWMKALKLDESEVAERNGVILERLEEFEREVREQRSKKGFRAKGASRLADEALSLQYRPKPGGKRIYVYAVCKDLRVRMIKEYEYFCKLCTDCYERWKIGDYTVEWPPGAFMPAMPPRYNFIA